MYFQSNRITKLEGLQNLISLKELYLSHNGIEVIEGLENNVSYRLNSVWCETFRFILQLSHIYFLSFTEKTHDAGHRSQPNKENREYQPSYGTGGVLGM